MTRLAKEVEFVGVKISTWVVVITFLLFDAALIKYLLTG